MLLHTATEEIGHIEMLATAVAMNLETAPAELQEQGAADGIVGAVMGGGSARHTVEGMLHRHLLSTGMAAYPGQLATACPSTCRTSTPAATWPPTCTATSPRRATGRVLAVRLYNATRIPA